MAVSKAVCEFGWQAPDFALPSTAGQVLQFSDIQGPKGTLVMFICNHCPYVLRVLDQIMADGRDLQALGIGVAAISANDAQSYPQDSFDQMKVMAETKGFSFPYLYDEPQDVARAYGAECTPEFYGFDAGGGLQYRGRLLGPDEGHGARRDLFEAMKAVAETGKGPQQQVPSMGCSIKWKRG